MKRAYLRFIGPGIIWAMMAVGQTHVILSTYAGAQYGFDLLWMIILSHLMVYPVFEYGVRYAIATGQPLTEAYFKMRRARWVTVPVLFLTFLVLTPLLLAAMGGVAAAVLFAAFPALGFANWVWIVAGVTVLLIVSGRYVWMQRINLAMAAILLAGIMVAFSLSPPSIDAFTSGLIPSIPTGAMITLVALMRLPSDAVTSILLSSWALQNIEGRQQADRKETLDGMIFGFRVGYALSIIVAIVYLSLGATVLKPLGVNLEGIDLALQLSLVFTETVGAWTFPLFIVIVFIALYAGYYSAIQSVPLLFMDIMKRLGLTKIKPGQSYNWLGWTHMVFVVLTGAAIAVGIAKPTFLVILTVSMGLIGLPLYYALNIFAAHKMLAPEYRPSRANSTLAIAGFIFAIVGSLLFFQTRIIA